MFLMKVLKDSAVPAEPEDRSEVASESVEAPANQSDQEPRNRCAAVCHQGADNAHGKADPPDDQDQKALVLREYLGDEQGRETRPENTCGDRMYE